MTVTIKKEQPEPVQTPVPAEPKTKRRTHVEAEPYSGSGVFTISNWMYYLGRSHSAVHARMKPSCKYRRLPPPDGGSSPFTWKPETAWLYLNRCLSWLLQHRGIAPPAL